MATYSAVTAGQKDADSPINVSLIDKLDQNPHAMFEGASGAPKLQPAAIDTTLEYDFDIVDATKLKVGGNEEISEIANITKMYAGQVASAGTAIDLPSGWSSSRPSTGNYTVTHNLGTTNYSIIPSTTSTNCRWYNKSSNSFDVNIYNNNITPNDVNADFDFILIVN
jgi:hypothetical protein